ncbi:related to protein transport protein SEC20 [Zygosaccharomyces bailii]|nr:related to protein transport protein SEC20 [Zygosaccharomyces bailii]
MALVYAQELRSLQTPMMQELSEIRSGKADEKQSRTSETIIEFESLLKAAVVCLNQETRFLKVHWYKKPDGTGLRVVNDAPEQYNSILKEVVQLVDFTDWLTEYKRKLKECIRHAHAEGLAQVDSKRDAAIQSNAMDLEVQGSPTTARDTTANFKPTKKDQLLNKTKQVSANLIRGNQILQAGVLQSDLNLDELKQQTSSLSRMNEKYSQLGTVFDKTSQLVKTLERASRQEKRDVYLSLGFLCMCVAWVLWRRIFKLPCKIALWILFRFFKTILAGVGLVTQKRATAVPVLATPSKIEVSATTTSIGSIAKTTSTTGIASIASTATTETTSGSQALEQAIDEAMGRIFPHDEL